MDQAALPGRTKRPKSTSFSVLDGFSALAMYVIALCFASSEKERAIFVICLCAVCVYFTRAPGSASRQGRTRERAREREREEERREGGREGYLMQKRVQTRHRRNLEWAPCFLLALALSSYWLCLLCALREILYAHTTHTWVFGAEEGFPGPEGAGLPGGSSAKAGAQATAKAAAHKAYLYVLIAVIKKIPENVCQGKTC